VGELRRVVDAGYLNIKLLNSPAVPGRPECH
jgi:hypothetical protein